MNPIYLDYNATAPVHAEVAEVVARTSLEASANPASQHAPGRRARQVVEDARESIAAALGIDLAIRRDRLIFTSGGTESNHLAILGLAGSSPAHVLVSAIEHPSLLGAAKLLARRGIAVECVPVDEHGVLAIDELARLVRAETRLVSVMAANNETGVIQPLADIVRIARAAGAMVHTDAVQYVGKLPLRFADLGVSAMTFTAHKLHGPIGIGALAVRGDVHLEPLFEGGSQQESLRPGTESAALAAGFAKAIELWHSQAAEHAAHLTALRERFERRLSSAWSSAVIHGSAAPRMPHTTNVAFGGFDRQELVIAFDAAGVACSTGSACASGSSEPSHVLIAMGLSKDLVGSSLRFSIGQRTTADEVDQAVDRIVAVSARLRDSTRRPRSGRGSESAAL